MTTKIRSSRSVALLWILAAAAARAGAFQPAPAPPLDKMALLKMLQAGGRAQDEFVAEIRKRGVDFRPTAQDETALAGAGANDAILAAVRASYRPAGPALSLADLKMLLELRAPRVNLDLLLETRGVDFAVTPQIAAEILAAGGDSALVGLVALHQRVAAKPETAAPQPGDTAGRGGLAVRQTGEIPGLEGAGCELRVWVDHVTELLLQASTLSFQVQRGSSPSDAGSACTQPLPQEEVPVTISKLRGRGTVTLVGRPSAANNHTVRLRIEDAAGGADLYHVRVLWGR